MIIIIMDTSYRVQIVLQNKNLVPWHTPFLWSTYCCTKQKLNVLAYTFHTHKYTESTHKGVAQTM